MPDSLTIAPLQAYLVGKERWECRRFDRAAAALAGLTPADLPLLHARLAPHARPWDVAARFFGLIPVILPLDDSVPKERRRVWEPKELAESLGVKPSGLQTELAAVAGVWASAKAGRDHAAELAAKATAAREAEFAAAGGELALDKDTAEETLRKFGYHESMFAGVADPALPDQVRDPAEAASEREWFAARVHQLRKPLEDPMAAELTRGILDNELRLRRYRHALRRRTALEANIGGEGVTRLEKTVQDLDKVYAMQLVELDGIAAWMGDLKGKLGFHGVIADVIRAIQMAHGRRDASLAAFIEQKTDVQVIFDKRDLVDGMFTAAEVMVALRTSRQAPKPQYRADVVAVVNEAKANLWDPKFQSQLPRHVLKRLRAGWDAAEEACRKELGAEVKEPDLLADGEAGEHEALPGAVVAV